ncbi:hypothetical protein AB0J29_13650, partial [Nocardia sp. NPDC049707]
GGTATSAITELPGVHSNLERHTRAAGVLRRSLSESAIHVGLADRIARYQIPTLLRVVTALPRDEFGKMYKRDLRALFGP